MKICSYLLLQNKEKQKTWRGEHTKKGENLKTTECSHLHNFSIHKEIRGGKKYEFHTLTTYIKSSAYKKCAKTIYHYIPVEAWEQF